MYSNTQTIQLDEPLYANYCRETKKQRPYYEELMKVSFHHNQKKVSTVDSF